MEFLLKKFGCEEEERVKVGIGMEVDQDGERDICGFQVQRFLEFFGNYIYGWIILIFNF